MTQEKSGKGAFWRITHIYNKQKYSGENSVRTIDGAHLAAHPNCAQTGTPPPPIVIDSKVSQPYEWTEPLDGGLCVSIYTYIHTKTYSYATILPGHFFFMPLF